MRWIVLGVVVLIVLIAISTYNRLVVLRNRFRNAFAQIDVQLKRRHDLIPNLVETAKGYLKHERETLEAVIAARGGAAGARERAAGRPGDPEAMKALSAAETQLHTTLGRLLVTVEAYPDLKANQTMSQLTEELTSTENRVAFARQAFNDAVMEYNNAREQFPNTFVAAPFGFGPASPFEISSPDERDAPKVAFA
jgi:LemA protein